MQRALDEYRALQSAASPQLRRAARFNSGNLYLEHAIAASASSDRSAALTFAELAKVAYRELLREDPDDFDARYNLEKTLRLAPDPSIEPEDFYSPPSTLRHSAPTGAGTSLGLP
jgi:mxaK protein